MPKRIRSLRCPICRTLVLRAAPEFPFCSERCRRIDLGKWASGKYVISSPLAEPELLELDEEHSSRDDNRD
jgi:hypothetical protein